MQLTIMIKNLLHGKRFIKFVLTSYGMWYFSMRLHSMNILSVPWSVWSSVKSKSLKLNSYSFNSRAEGTQLFCIVVDKESRRKIFFLQFQSTFLLSSNKIYLGQILSFCCWQLVTSYLVGRVSWCEDCEYSMNNF